MTQAVTQGQRTLSGCPDPLGAGNRGGVCFVSGKPPAKFFASKNHRPTTAMLPERMLCTNAVHEAAYGARS